MSVPGSTDIPQGKSRKAFPRGNLELELKTREGQQATGERGRAALLQRTNHSGGTSLLHPGWAPELACFRKSLSRPSLHWLPEPSSKGKPPVQEHPAHSGHGPLWEGSKLSPANKIPHQGYCFFIQSPSNWPSLWMVFALSENRPLTAAGGSHFGWWSKNFRGSWGPWGWAGWVGKCCSTIVKDRRDVKW